VLLGEGGLGWPYEGLGAVVVLLGEGLAGRRGESLGAVVGLLGEGACGAALSDDCVRWAWAPMWDG